MADWRIPGWNRICLCMYIQYCFYIKQTWNQLSSTFETDGLWVFELLYFVEGCVHVIESKNIKLLCVMSWLKHTKCRFYDNCQTVHNTINIGIRDAKPPAYAKHSLSRIIVDYKKKVKRNIFLTTSFSQRLSHTVFLTISFSQRLSHNGLFTTPFSHLSPYIALHSLLYKYPKISQICLNSDPRNFINFSWSNWNLDVAHQQCIFCHCMKFQNPRTKASYPSCADKVLYEYPKISQIGLSSDRRYIDNFWSIKLKPQRCTSTIYILSLCEVSQT